jgi:hypothetical protein
MSKATDDVLAERQRQIDAEGWSAEHDDEHMFGDLAVAGACYAIESTPLRLPRSAPKQVEPDIWPWTDDWWKPKDKRRNLVRAAALIIAEIERLDRR